MIVMNKSACVKRLSRKWESPKLQLKIHERNRASNDIYKR